MDRYMVTHSLLSSWLYLLKENPFEDATSEGDPAAEFMATLRRQPSTPNEVMQNGIDFEALVTKALSGKAPADHKWYVPAHDVAGIIHGGMLQLTAKREVEIDGIPVLLYGRLDALKAGTIYDIKFSKSYESGKYIDGTQHPMYFSIVPEAFEFTYLVSNGANVWYETYRRDEAQDIRGTVSQFLGWLETQGLTRIYRECWRAK